MSSAPRVLFLPGAGGAAGFWHPVGQRLPSGWEKTYISWPGLGDQPADPAIACYDDLVARVVDALDRPAPLVAQSIGGVVALRVALGHPHLIRRLVLAATSGGLDVAGLGGADWRDDYRRAYPRAGRWVTAELIDHVEDLHLVHAPTLLLWGQNDPTSPVAVGRRLAQALPGGVLRVIDGGDHSFAHDRSDIVAPLIAAHLR